MIAVILPLLTAAFGGVSDSAPLHTSERRSPEVDGADSLLEMRGDFRVGARIQPYRVLAPQHGKELPVLVFSHGAYAANDTYDLILKPWAQAGFIVVAPTHADSVKLGTQRGDPNPNFYPWRLDDMRALVGQLPSLMGTTGLAPRADLTRVVMAGHSFGGWVAQTLAGAYASSRTESEPDLGPLSDPVPQCVIVISGAGLIPGRLEAADLAALNVPLLVTVGTDDLAQAPGLTGYAWRRQPFDYALSSPRWLLVMDGADHYLGGQVGREDLEPSAYRDDYLHDFLHVSSLFLRTCSTARDAITPDGMSETFKFKLPNLRRGRLEYAIASPP
jgi:pimeloyl-ACP methyl ester carboxylesterase